MLTKQNVCLYIKDEEHLEEMREFLEGKGERIHETSFYISSSRFNYLQYGVKTGYFISFYLPFKEDSTRELTTEQFKKLWE